MKTPRKYRLEKCQASCGRKARRALPLDYVELVLCAKCVRDIARQEAGASDDRVYEDQS